MFKPNRSRVLLIPCSIGLLYAASAGALVVEPTSSVASTPDDAVVARWGGNGSGVVVSSQHILTTRHQGGGVGTTVNVDGTNYTVAEITIIQDPDTPANQLDLRVARLETLGGLAPTFTQTVGIYTGTDELGKTLTVGGFGEGRGDAITSGSSTVGYDWDGAEGTLRWGANTVTQVREDAAFGAFNNDDIIAVFNTPGSTNAVDGEASLAFGDSGGGWFFFDGSDWQLVGLSQGVENTEEALFGEALSSVRISSYATQINNAIPEPSTALLFTAALAGLAVRRRRPSCGCA